MTETVERAMATARNAGLSYSLDDGEGHSRRRRGTGWSFHRADGSLIKDHAERKRIESLAIPPAWTDVWISANPKNHLLATGRDDKGRKQYIYHAEWERARDAEKFRRLGRFGFRLSNIRKTVQQSLGGNALDRDTVLAAVVAVLDATGIRVGNDEYARENDTYGITTLRDRHVTVNGSTVRFEFSAKGNQEATFELADPHLAKIIRACQAVPGYEVFKWKEPDGSKRDVTSGDVNDYIQSVAELDVTAKDFRTWIGTAHAFEILCECDPPTCDDEADQACLRAVDQVAERLRNTRAVARDSYIHPGILESYKKGAFARRLPTGRRSRHPLLSDNERRLLGILEQAD